MELSRSLIVGLYFLLGSVFLISACSFDEGSGGDNSAASSEEDDTLPAGDDDSALTDDDSEVADDDDSSADDDVLPDDYLAPWPQSNVETDDYDESGAAGPFREKAEAYDLWHLNHHQPYYGGTVGVLFEDDERTTEAAYYDWGDSCEWTGLYLGSQALRYRVTKEPQAKTNTIRVAHALDGYLHVTGTPGFIARYWGKQDPLIYQGDEWCAADDWCHKVDSGPYAGDFWWGETSRDMYSGWFFGMSLAYDMIDDEDTRNMIRDDVSEVLNTLMDQGWKILDEEGLPTTRAPDITPAFKLSWLTVGYHITGEERIKTELRETIRNKNRLMLQLSSITYFNRYMEYFGNCLAHESWYNLLRLAKVYFSPDDYGFLIDMFNNEIHTFARLSHNPWFSMVYMGQGGYQPGESTDPYREQLVQDFGDFPDAPHFRYYLPAKDPSTYTLDPISVFLHDLEVRWPFLAGLIGSVDYQALDPFPVTGYCASDFIFQWSPFIINECGEDNPRKVDPGVDYLIPYWLASYHKFIAKDQ